MTLGAQMRFWARGAGMGLTTGWVYLDPPFTWIASRPAIRLLRAGEEVKEEAALPNRFTRGSQFGHEDFANFCLVASSLGRSVTHMVRGHDHVEERYFFYPAYKAYPILTTVGLSRRLSRETVGTYERVPTAALYTKNSLPQVFRTQNPLRSSSRNLSRDIRC